MTINCNYLTFEFGLKCENSLTVNTDNDITIKILHQNNEEKVKLLKDNNKIVKIVTGKDIDIKDIKKEYKI